MCLLLILGTFFLPAFSTDVSAKSAPGALGICDIENPTYDSANGDNNPHPSEYNRVYFGYIPDETTGKIGGTSPYGTVKDVPIYWRVLNTTANDESATPALFMLTEYTLPTGVAWDSRDVQKWSYMDMDGSTNKTDSAIRKFLQGTSCKATYTGSSYKADADANNNIAADTIGFYDQCFDKPEQEAIMYTTNGERLNYYNNNNSYRAQYTVECDADGADRPYYYNTSGKKSGDGSTSAESYIFCGCGLNEEKIFLLSAKEVLDTKYGFEDKYDAKYTSNTGTNYYYTSCDTNRAARTLSAASGSNNSYWWLRSACSYDRHYVACVESSGDYYFRRDNSTGVCVRCALNIPLSSILFATNADSPSPTPSSTFTSIASTSLSGTRSTDPDSGAGAKLTIVDDVSPRRNFWVPQGKYSWSRASEGAATLITLPYRRAVTGEGEYISAIIKDQKDEHRFYARLKEVRYPDDANSTVELCIPNSAELPNGGYTLIIMNEKDNGYRRTNYAKNANLWLTVDGEKITITGNNALGACTIKNPEYDENGSIYDRVYFGRTPTLADDTNTIQLWRKEYSSTENGQVYVLHNQPIYWRVLNTTANDISGTPALFMLTEYCISNTMSWDNTPKSGNASSGLNYKQCWTKSPADSTGGNSTTDSAIKIFLNGTAGGTYNASLTNISGYNDKAITTGAVYEANNSQHSAYNDCFEPTEQNIIMSTYNGEDFENDKIEWHNNPYYAHGCGLSGEKLFLLSAKEIINKEYGFNPTKHTTETEYIYQSDINRQTRQYDSSKTSSRWWLRSAQSSYTSGVTCVSYSGYCSDLSSYNTGVCVRCALNIPLSSVLFTSDASIEGTGLTQLDAVPSFVPITDDNSKSKLPRTKITYPGENTGTATISSLTTINPTPTSTSVVPYLVWNLENTSTVTVTPAATATVQYGAGTKLTIVDDDRDSFTVEENIISGGKGQSISVHYSGATVGADEYISAIIKDTSGNPLYHARLKSVGTSTEDSSGTLSMYIPDNIDYGDYNLIVYNEKEREEWNTNYAGYDTLELTVKDSTSPTVTNIYRNEQGNKFKLTTSDENLSHISTTVGQRIIDLSGTEATKSFQIGNATNGIRVYDVAGNATTKYAEDMIEDCTPPTVSVSYSGGTYTLTVSDTESGVWKITSSNGNTIYHDYSSTTT